MRVKHLQPLASALVLAVAWIVGYPDRAQRAPFGRQEAVAQVARFQSEYPEPLTDSGSRLDSDSIVDR